MTDLAPLLMALNAVMDKVGYVQKGSRNTFHNYNYAGEKELLEVLRPAMVEHGLLLLPSLDIDPVIDEYGNTHLVVAYTLAHTSGAVWPEKLRVPGCGNDKNKSGIGDKGTYKALTGANKYALFKLFQIATGDDPEVPNAVDKGEATTSAPAPAKPADTAATVLSAVTKATSTSAIDAVMKQYAIAIKAMEKTAKASYDKVKATVQARREELNQKAELTPAKE